MIIPFKDRTVDPSKKIWVYRNLHAKTPEQKYSIRQNGLVVGHTNNLIMSNCEFRVGQKGRERVLRTGQKNVHSFIVGEISDFLPHNSDNWRAVRYNPYDAEYFHLTGTDLPVYRAVFVKVGDIITAAILN